MWTIVDVKCVEDEVFLLVVVLEESRKTSLMMNTENSLRKHRYKTDHKQFVAFLQILLLGNGIGNANLLQDGIVDTFQGRTIEQTMGSTGIHSLSTLVLQ